MKETKIIVSKRSGKPIVEVPSSNSGKSCHRVDLSGWNLNYAELSHIAFNESDFTGATMIGARLCHTSLRGCILRDVNFNRVEMREVDFSLADLRGARFNYAVPKVSKLWSRIHEAIHEPKRCLTMRDWHHYTIDGKEAHCLAGWAVTLAGDEGQRLEELVGTAAAGALLFHATYPEAITPDFFGDVGDTIRLIDAQAKLEEQVKITKRVEREANPTPEETLVDDLIQMLTKWKASRIERDVEAAQPEPVKPAPTPKRRPVTQASTIKRAKSRRRSLNGNGKH